MRARIYWFTLLLLIFMVKTACNGCGKPFERISLHQQKCKSAHTLYGGLKRHVEKRQKVKQEEADEARRVEMKRREVAARREHAEEIKERRRQAELIALQPIFTPTASRSGRQHRAPAKVRDMVPTSLRGLPAHLPRPPPPPALPSGPALQDFDNPFVPEPSPPPPPAVSQFDTPPNRFGVFRRYEGRLPRRDPEEGLPVHTFADAASHLRPPSDLPREHDLRPLGSTFTRLLRDAKEVAAKSYAPFLNWTTFKLMQWHYSGSNTKSAGELQRLVDEVIMQDDFKKSDLAGFNVAREKQRLDESTISGRPFSEDDGWRESSVDLKLPQEKREHTSEAAAATHTITGIWTRKFTSLIRDACEDPLASKYHWLPFSLFRRRSSAAHPDAPPERLYSEFYNSDAMKEENKKLQAQERNPEDDASVEYALAPLVVYSDSTHLTNFGTASLWPIYVWLGSLTKYIRIKPSMFAAHHLAYIPALSATSLSQAYKAAYKEPPTAATLRLLKQDLMQKIWLMLLDDDFMRAYTHGMLVKCGDGIVRRIFPRIFTYIADYPEKCLIACIKQLGKHPCPDCLVNKCDIHKMGTANDLAHRAQHPRKDNEHTHSWIARVRRWIFEEGTAPDGEAIKKTPLGDVSANPTRSAFSVRFAEFGLNAYQLLVPDLMHEFELGVWKSTFTHLMRILIAAGNHAVQVLDERYAMVPTFGRRTIRRFGKNMSAMKKLAARDFEQLLQCSIPVFERLLPAPFDSIVTTMLFRLCQWHALAKLRIHTESTLDSLDTATSSLGISMRAFQKSVCPHFQTKELPKETQQRHARKMRSAKAPGPKAAQTRKATHTAKGKSLSLDTYKYHRLADYVRAIRLFGTTDNFTSQSGEQEHRRPKGLFPRTNKNRKFAYQIAQEVRRQAILHKLGQKCLPKSRRRHRIGARARQLRLRAATAEPLGPAPPEAAFQISDDQRNHVELREFLGEHLGDPACKNFVRSLKEHLLRRMPGGENIPLDNIPSNDDIRSLRIINDKLYMHQTLRVNYTSYDMRRDQDSLNPRTHPDIMMYSVDHPTHPYLYARILAIFHVNAYQAGADLSGAEDTEPRTIPVVWVRWFDLDHSAPGGFEECRLHRLAWADDDDAYGFIAPEDVLRAAHIIPAFAHGTTPVDWQPTAADESDKRAEEEEEEEEEWKLHYVNMFVDRDMFMRYLGDGVGHQRDGGVGSPAPPQSNLAEGPEEDDDEELDQVGREGVDSEDEQVDYGSSSDSEDEDAEDVDADDAGEDNGMPGSWNLKSDDEDDGHGSDQDAGHDDDDDLLDAGGFNAY